MPDITLINSMLSSIKAAYDITICLKDANFSIEQAEGKFKLVEVLSLLTEAKTNAIQLQKTINDKDSEIQKLKEALKFCKLLIRHNDAYYLVDSLGQASGEPFCLCCWESDNVAVHLVNDTDKKICPRCKNSYMNNRVPIIYL